MGAKQNLLSGINHTEKSEEERQIKFTEGTL